MRLKDAQDFQRVHFVPAYDEWFNETYVKEWGEKNDTDVIVDNIHNVGIPTRAEAEVAAKKGTTCSCSTGRLRSSKSK